MATESRPHHWQDTTTPGFVRKPAGLVAGVAVGLPAQSGTTQRPWANVFMSRSNCPSQVAGPGQPVPPEFVEPARRRPIVSTHSVPPSKGTPVTIGALE